MNENKRLKLSDVFDIELLLRDGKFWYELEFEDYILEQPSDFPVKAVLRKGKRISKKEAFS